MLTTLQRALYRASIKRLIVQCLDLSAPRLKPNEKAAIVADLAIRYLPGETDEKQEGPDNVYCMPC